MKRSESNSKSQVQVPPKKVTKTCKKVSFNSQPSKQIMYDITLPTIIANYTSGENISLIIIEKPFKIGLFTYKNKTWELVHGNPLNNGINLNDLKIGMKLRKYKFVECAESEELPLLSKTTRLYHEYVILKEDIEDKCSSLEDDEFELDELEELREEIKIGNQQLTNMQDLLTKISSSCKFTDDCRYIFYLHANFTQESAIAIKDYLKLSKKKTLSNAESATLEKAKKIIEGKTILNCNYDPNHNIVKEQCKDMVFKGYYCYNPTEDKPLFLDL